MNQTDEKPIDPNCPNAPSGACPKIVRFQGGGRQMSWCQHCNEFSHRRLAESQERTRRRMLMPPPTTRLQVLELAAAAHAQYPQYDGKWRDPAYKLIRAKHDVDGGKLIDPILKGDITLAREETRGEFDGWWFAYSWRREINTLIRREEFDFVEE